MKKCITCYKLKNEKEFNRSGKSLDKLRGDCRDCQHIYANNYYHEQKRTTENWISPWKRKKYKFIELYGGKCECCGEIEERFLTLDHVNGQVGKKKEKTALAMGWAINNYQPEKYRILCWNCNQAVRWGRICPHKLINLSGGR